MREDAEPSRGQEAPCAPPSRRYASFDEFLMNLKQSKRKAIRQASSQAPLSVQRVH